MDKALLILVAVFFPVFIYSFLSSGSAALSAWIEHKLFSGLNPNLMTVRKDTGSLMVVEPFTSSEIQRIKSLPEVKTLARICAAPVIFSINNHSSQGIVFGADPILLKMGSTLKIDKGHFPKGNDLLVGSLVGLKKGDMLIANGEPAKVSGVLKQSRLMFGFADAIVFANYNHYCKQADSLRILFTGDPDELKAKMERILNQDLRVTSAKSLLKKISIFLTALKLFTLVIVSGSLLSSLGVIYGVLSSLVESMRKEIGVLRALGMTSRDVFVWFLREIAPWVLISFIVVPPLPLFFGLPFPDIFGLAVIFITTASAVALPAYQAMKISPSEAMRQ